MKARLFFTPLVSLLGALILYLAIAGIGQAHRLSGHPKTLKGRLDQARRQVAHDRREVAVVQSRSWALIAPLSYMAAWHRRWLVRDLRYVGQLQRAVNQTALGPVWLVNAFMCIHRGEGAWTANTGNGFYGGLQMDYGFMSTYGGSLLASKGTADHWTPAEQIGVAIRAWRTRGFYPWPNTARACGLL